MSDTNDVKSPGEVAQISHREKQFRTDVGVNATVQHQDMKGEQAAVLNRQLADVGLAAQEEDPALKGMRYMGSAAVHIYQSHVLRQLYFISQTDPLITYRCPEMLASTAFNHLLATLKKTFGHGRPKLRSGF